MQRAFFRIPVLVGIGLMAVTSTQALQGGPTMPEYVKFEPADITDIVNLNTGDFVYSVPLGDVPGPAGGFPLSMSYHSGVGHDQEATWVGLGWTLNPGAINRMLRGYPDDVHNSATYSYVYYRTKTSGWGVTIGAGYGPVGLNMTYDTDKGFGGSVSLSALQMGPARMGVDIGTNGVSLSVQMAMTQVGVGMGKDGVSASLGFGGNVGQATVGASMGVHMGWGGDATTFGSMGLSAAPVPGNDKGMNLIGHSFSSSSPSGGSVSIAGAGFASASASSGSARSQIVTGGFGLTIPFPGGAWVSVGFNHYEHEIRISDATALAMYGYMYQGGKAVKVRNIENLPEGGGVVQASGGTGIRGQYSNFIWKDLGPSMENMEIGLESQTPPLATTRAGWVGGEASASEYWMLAPSNDVYSASGQGISGPFRPFGKREHSFYQVISHKDAEEPFRKSFLMNPHKLDGGSILHQDQSKLIFVGAEPGEDLRATADNLLAYLENPHPEYPEVDYYYCMEGRVPYEDAINGTTRPDVAQLFNDLNEDAVSSNDCSPYAFLKSNIRNEDNRLLVSEDDRERYRVTPHTNMRFAFMADMGQYSKYRFDDTLHWSYGGRQIIPLLESDGIGKPDAGGRLKGFKIVDMDGKQYFYEQPVYSLLQIDYSTDLEKGMPSFVRNKSEKFSWAAQMTPYATQWLLTEVRGADFIKVSETDMSANYGYQVKLNYTDPVQYNWRTPYAPPNMALSDLPNLPLPEKNKYIGSMGQKELVYLESVESATHKAVFNLNNPVTEERQDSREWKTSWLGNSATPVGPPLELPVTLMFEYAGDTYLSASGSDEWEQGWLGHNPPQTVYLFDVEYECRTAYIPVRLSESELENLKSLELSYFSASFSYFANYDFFIDVEFTTSGPIISRTGNADQYLSVEVERIEPTSGDEERFGPYKVIFKDPVSVNGFMRDPDGPSANRDYLKGKVYLGPVSYWEVSGQLREMKGRHRGDFDDDYCGADHVNWESWNCYAERLAPIPPKMNVVPWYQNNPGRNQARFLKSVDIYKKEGNVKLRTFAFDYGYDLCGKTPNSYPHQPPPSLYPADVSGLNGKLTLKSVQETGYDLMSGQPSSLPPFEFDYPQAGDFVQGQNPDYYDWQPANLSTTSTAFFTALAESPLKSDPWGMFNPMGNKLNQKIANQTSLGVTWNLSKITNPLGGELIINYERDRVQDQEYNFFNGTKPLAFMGSTGGDGWDRNGAGEIVLSPLTTSAFELIWTDLPPPWSINLSKRYFEGLTKEEALERFRFADGTYEDLNVGDEVLIVFKGWVVYQANDGGDDLTAHLYFSTTTRISTKNPSTGAISLQHLPADLPHPETLFKQKMEEIDRNVHDYQSSNSGVLLAAVYPRNKKTVYGDGVRVASLTSCFDHCRTTAYTYEDAALATRPDSVFSNDWLSKNLFTDAGRPRLFGENRDFLGFRLGKNAVPTRGVDYDVPFMPNSSISYGKVTVTNIDQTLCSSADNQIEGCVINGKTEYTFWTPNDFGAATGTLGGTTVPNFLLSVPETITRDGESYSKLRFHDYSSIVGRPKAVTYFGSEWAGTTSPKTEYFMISKDSMEYEWSPFDVEEKWDSERRFGTNGNDVHRLFGEYHRHQPRLSKQSKYQFVKRELGETRVSEVDHLKSTTENGEVDPLTGTVLSSLVKYQDGLDPAVTMVKRTSTELMSSLGTSGSHPIPAEMRRRNMLTQPFNEVITSFNLATPAAVKMLDYKLNLWGSADPGNLRGASIFKKGDLVPTFALPQPGDLGSLGIPSNVYSSGYDLSKWNGSQVLAIDRHSHALEIRSPTGTISSAFYSQDGMDQVGFVVNSPRASSRAMTFNGDPEINRDWQYTNGGQYRKGSFILPMGAMPPLVDRRMPLTNGETYTITVRARTRGATTSLAVDFFTRFPVFNFPGPGFEWRTLEGPQQNFTVTPAWTTFTFNATVSASTYPHPSGVLVSFTPNLLNQLRFFVDDPTALSGGLDHDVLIDFITVTKSPVAPEALVTRFGEWSLSHAGKFLTSNARAIYSSASGFTSVMQTPLDLSKTAQDEIIVEFKARANAPATALEVDFVCGSGCEGDQKQVIIGESWEKHRIVLDRRNYSSISSYPANVLRLFCDSQNDREIEVAWVRAYPREAQANSFVHDARGSVLELVNENMVSSYFTYDGLGRLTGMRNDDGVVGSEQRLNYGKK